METTIHTAEELKALLSVTVSAQDVAKAIIRMAREPLYQGKTERLPWEEPEHGQSPPR